MPVFEATISEFQFLIGSLKTLINHLQNQEEKICFNSL